MEDAVTSNPGTITDVLLSSRLKLYCDSGRLNVFLAAPPHVIDLPDDDDNEPLRVKRKKKALAGKTLQSTPAPEAVVRDDGEPTRASVTFAVPLTSVRPSASTADPSSLFAAYPVPEDQAAAAKEAVRQAGIMMEQVKVAREACQAAYDASSALQSNVQVSRLQHLVCFGMSFEDSLFRRSLSLYTHWVCLPILGRVGAR